MEISLLALIGIALGTMFFGYFFGLFEGAARDTEAPEGRETVRPPAGGLNDHPIAHGTSLLQLSLNERRSRSPG
jgi:hypothetical protein